MNNICCCCCLNLLLNSTLPQYHGTYLFATLPIPSGVGYQNVSKGPNTSNLGLVLYWQYCQIFSFVNNYINGNHKQTDKFISPCMLLYGPLYYSILYGVNIPEQDLVFSVKLQFSLVFVQLDLSLKLNTKIQV